MHSQRKTPKLFARCSILASLAIGCVSNPERTRPKEAVTIDLDWSFTDLDGEPQACLKQDDVVELRERLVRCGYEDSSR
jgi:hypothetical protein